MYLWEIVVLFRKGTLSLLGIAFRHIPRTQVLLGLLVRNIITQ